MDFFKSSILTYPGTFAPSDKSDFDYKLTSDKNFTDLSTEADGSGIVSSAAYEVTIFYIKINTDTVDLSQYISGSDTQRCALLSPDALVWGRLGSLIGT